ncbi:carbohydrate porin [uncultured Methylobacterium sp.]|uniref:carbohydrate porin n=1 Tax=uncultured Methylobacterium sp. TaxID=157278 RepID=UPI0035CAE1DD
MQVRTGSRPSSGSGRETQGPAPSIYRNRSIPTQQIMMELNYGIQVTPAIRLTPNLQYIVNPDQTRFPYYPKNIPDAFVVGAKLSVDLFTLAGLAKGPGSR